MVTLVWRTDVHISDVNPVSRTDNWMETVLHKLREVGEIARSVKADAVIDGGDFFNLKSPNRTSHELIQAVCNVHRDYPCPVYANIGNHDCLYGNYAYLYRQPLGVLFASGVFRPLYDDHEAFFEQDGVKVRVVGIPYHGTTYDMERFERIQRGDETYLMVAAHLLASSAPSAMFDSEDVIQYKDLARFPLDLVAFGHWHKDQGVYHMDDKRKIVNIGSLSRGALSQDNLERTPKVAILRFTEDGIHVEERKLTVKPVEDVFDFARKEREETHDVAMDVLMTKMISSFTPTTRLDLQDAVRSMDVPEAVKEITCYYIEQAGKAP